MNSRGDTDGIQRDEHDDSRPDSGRGQSAQGQDDRLVAESTDHRPDHDQLPEKRAPLSSVQQPEKRAPLSSVQQPEKRAPLSSEVAQLGFGAVRIGTEFFCVKHAASRPFCHFCQSATRAVVLVGQDGSGNPRRACQVCVDTNEMGGIDGMDETRRVEILAGFALLLSA